MAEESEKRFEALMNKLFHTPPKSKPDSNNTRQGVQKLSGRKRPHSSSVGSRSGNNALGESTNSLLGTTVSAQSPQCRPWDRNDLFRRLSTFKSMTWFAKPQVVSPLECARRGWVNIDVDIIACASCDARLLFSTPSAWTRQQVEKAAMVFSLKLESGHKFLCAWINNICTEELSQFPIMTPAALIGDYRKRLFSISHLLALPLILPAAITSLRSSELEQFLRESSASGCNIPLEDSSAVLHKDVPESISSISYYQVQKIISLFGWEPHVLPYRVDFKNEKHQSLKDANITVTAGEKKKVSIYSLCSSESTEASSAMKFDPCCVVLDCKLCGASVGLWAFATVPRPLECLRFIGPTVVNSNTRSISSQVSAQEGSSSNQVHIGKDQGIRNPVATDSTSLGFTIAGGLPPAMLNYAATISLPIVGDNLRARLPRETENDHFASLRSAQVVEDQQMSGVSENATVEGLSATSGPDSVSRDPLDVPQTGANNSDVNVNLTETARTVNTIIAEHSISDKEGLHCSTPVDNILVIHGGESESSKQSMNKAKNYEHGPISAGEDNKLPSISKSMEFDLVKQHRHFCPWIFSTGKFTPGWQQTLTALKDYKEVKDTPSSSLIEVDDPVASVEKFFTSSSQKRTKVLGGI